MERGIQFEKSVADVLIEFIKGTLKQELRPCFPRDIVNQICWAAKYENKPPLLTHRTVMRAIESYFLVKG